ncbi:acetyl-CoA carboxylase, carboxyl transferase subunit beta [Janibacter hoylei PVAS-1]|uniref:acetyl-CoA carboxytransferase n=1 Tax=Janibacter hoylei PVAS-1 TaxID=1210046 RepID=K1E0J8_9MICO|nr:acetyl-CoA carboxylase, carboxyl transferase subunit beta [Janibacter hoylei PVAS-1]
MADRSLRLAAGAGRGGGRRGLGGPSRRPEGGDRPGVRELLRHAADDVIPLNGTGYGESDKGVMLALASFGSRPCVLVGQDRRYQVAESMGPAALREARRGMRMARELGLPLVTVIDTPGADLSPRAEEGALAGEIARCIADMTALDVPSVSVLLGEGTGGGRAGAAARAAGRRRRQCLAVAAAAGGGECHRLQGHRARRSARRPPAGRRPTHARGRARRRHRRGVPRGPRGPGGLRPGDRRGGGRPGRRTARSVRERVRRGSGGQPAIASPSHTGISTTARSVAR